jgi:hypothetical protein
MVAPIVVVCFSLHVDRSWSGGTFCPVGCVIVPSLRASVRHCNIVLPSFRTVCVDSSLRTSVRPCIIVRPSLRTSVRRLISVCPRPSPCRCLCRCPCPRPRPRPCPCPFPRRGRRREPYTTSLFTSRRRTRRSSSRGGSGRMFPCGRWRRRGRTSVARHPECPSACGRPRR